MKDFDIQELVIIERPTSITWDEITDLLHRAYSIHLSKQIFFTAGVQSTETTILKAENGVCLVALWKGKLVGTITIHDNDVFQNSKWYYEDNAKYICQFGVDILYQNFGVGSKLWDHAVAMASKSKAKAILFDTALPAIDTIQFYIKKGCKKVDVVSWPNTNYLSVVLKKELSCEIVPEELCSQLFEEALSNFKQPKLDDKSSKPEIVIIVTNLTQFYSILPAIKELDLNGISYDLLVPLWEEEVYKKNGEEALINDTYRFLIRQGYRPIRHFENSYKIAFSCYPNTKVHANYNIRYRYSMVTKPDFSFDVYNGIFYDIILCYGRYDEDYLCAYSKTHIIGELKTAGFKKTNDANTGKLTILYAPTFGKLSSIPTVAKELVKLKDSYRIIVKEHHMTSFFTDDEQNLGIIKDTFDEIFDSHTPLYDLIAMADIVLSDNSGAIFDALATETPVAIFTQSEPIVFEGKLALQFQLIQEGIIPATNNSNAIRDILQLALSPEYVIKQKNCKKRVFEISGQECADEFIHLTKTLLKSDTNSGYVCAHRRLFKEYLQLLIKNESEQKRFEMQRESEHNQFRAQRDNERKQFNDILKSCISQLDSIQQSRSYKLYLIIRHLVVRIRGNLSSRDLLDGVKENITKFLSEVGEKND